MAVNYLTGLVLTTKWIKSEVGVNRAFRSAKLTDTDSSFGFTCGLTSIGKGFEGTQPLTVFYIISSMNPFSIITETALRSVNFGFMTFCYPVFINIKMAALVQHFYLYSVHTGVLTPIHFVVGTSRARS